MGAEAELRRLVLREVEARVRVTEHYESAAMVEFALLVDPPRGKGTTRERVRWLLANQRLWDGLYPVLDGVRTQRPGPDDLLSLAEHAKDAGVYSGKTGTRDVAHSLVRLVPLARACQQYGVRP